MKIKLKEIKQLGKFNTKYKGYRQSNKERKRDDIDSKKLYLVDYGGILLIGRFEMRWYGWNFEPNMGSMSIQIELLNKIYEINGLDQAKSGDTASHILGYLYDSGEI